jgi:hypothetical protein
MAGKPGKCPSFSFHHFDGRTDGTLNQTRIGGESPRSNSRALSRHFLCPTRAVNTAFSKKRTRIGSLVRWALPSPPPSLFCYVRPPSRHWHPAPPPVALASRRARDTVSAVYSLCVLECALKILILMHICKNSNVHFENGWCYFLGSRGTKHRPVTHVAEKGT